MFSDIPQSELEALLARFSPSDAGANLAALASAFPGAVTCSTSFSLEDQVLSHLIFDNRLAITVFTLDTGRLFPETYSTWAETVRRYQQPLTAYYPDAGLLQHFVAAHGPNSFYHSPENRQTCCQIRKVEPLKRALYGKKIWITGIRAAHSPDRQALEQLEWDPINEVYKYHPLLFWDSDAVRKFIDAHQVPFNPLQEKGFASIGCAPCTRAIRPGEDFRAGRWWWEHSETKECGLHQHRKSSQES